MPFRLASSCGWVRVDVFSWPPGQSISRNYGREIWIEREYFSQGLGKQLALRVALGVAQSWGVTWRGRLGSQAALAALGSSGFQIAPPGQNVL